MIERGSTKGIIKTTSVKFEIIFHYLILYNVLFALIQKREILFLKKNNLSSFAFGNKLLQVALLRLCAFERLHRVTSS